MYCRECGEKNPEDAVFCRNCGTRLIEEVKKAEVIITPNEQNYEQKTQTTTKTSSSDKSSDWLSCCLCLVVIFFVFGLIAAL